MFFAIVELSYTLIDALCEAWAAADLGRRLAAWWHVVTHRAEIHRSIDVVVIRGGGDG